MLPEAGTSGQSSWCEAQGWGLAVSPGQLRRLNFHTFIGRSKDGEVILRIRATRSIMWVFKWLLLHQQLQPRHKICRMLYSPTLQLLAQLIDWGPRGWRVSNWQAPNVCWTPRRTQVGDWIPHSTQRDVNSFFVIALKDLHLFPSFMSLALWYFALSKTKK